jgi:hypothetical protein
MNTDSIPKTKDLKEEYFRSDGMSTFALPEPEPARTHVRQLQQALAAENRAQVQKAANAVASILASTFQIPLSPVKVLGVRPREVTETSVYELFGDYDTETLRIRLWMRTAVLQKPSAFGTFLSTLCHELCHHLDLVHLELPNTYHTRGFYERAGLLYHHLRDTPLRRLVWTRLADGRYYINWPATMKGSPLVPGSPP